MFVGKGVGGYPGLELNFAVATRRRCNLDVTQTIRRRRKQHSIRWIKKNQRGTCTIVQMGFSLKRGWWGTRDGSCCLVQTPESGQSLCSSVKKKLVGQSRGAPGLPRPKTCPRLS